MGRDREILEIVARYCGKTSSIYRYIAQDIAALTREAAPQAGGGDGEVEELFRRLTRDDSTPDEIESRMKLRDIIRRIATTDSAIQSQQGATGGAEWRHIANEWADAATNGLQWLRNVRDGVCLPEKGIAEMVENFARIRALTSTAAKAAEGAE